jgi:3-phenylpropionate/trans-cinnamate dioxygenase ferredoxin reductase subunit
VLYLRQADDAIALRAAAPQADDVVVIGAGFIGLEAAASLHSMGKHVTVLETGRRILRRSVGEQTSDYILQHHLDAGIDVILDAHVASIESDDSGKARAVHLTDGRVLPAQIVLVGIGVLPNTELAQSLGLKVDNGIVVDSNAVASDGRTLVVGDVANLPNPMPGAAVGDRVRLESVNNAIEHAKVAAYSLVGRREDYSGIPWFWSNQGAMKLQIAGLSSGYDTTVVRRDPAKGKFTVLYYRGAQIIAADCINAPLDFMAVRTALSKGMTIPPGPAADASAQLKPLITDV